MQQKQDDHVTNIKICGPQNHPAIYETDSLTHSLTVELVTFSTTTTLQSQRVQTVAEDIPVRGPRHFVTF